MRLIIAPLLIFAEEAAHVEMKGEGWLFMAAAWFFILTLVAFTFGKVLKK
jgi:hypothetical protein